MGREGQGDRRDGLGEENTASGQAVDVRRLDAPISINADMVRPERINGDEENIGRTGKDRSREEGRGGRQAKSGPAEDASKNRAGESHGKHLIRNGREWG
jgi:hypothetical protein